MAAGAVPVRVLRVVSVLGVAALLALFVQRLAQGTPAGSLSAAALRGKPAAPDVRLNVIWPRASTWPARYRRLATRDKLSPIDLRGRVVVMNFWASWCDPCKSELQRLTAAAKRHRGSVIFLGVDINDFTGDAMHFLDRGRVDYVSLRGGSGASTAYGLIGLPETYYLDARGRVVGRTAGEVSSGQLEDGIKRAAGS